jgi:hypothetical protein
MHDKHGYLRSFAWLPCLILVEVENPAARIGTDPDSCEYDAGGSLRLNV